MDFSRRTIAPIAKFRQRERFAGRHARGTQLAKAVFLPLSGDALLRKFDRGRWMSFNRICRMTRLALRCPEHLRALEDM